MAFQRRPEPAIGATPVVPTVDAWDAPAAVPEVPFAPAGGDPTALLPWMDDVLGFGAGTSRDETPAPRSNAPAPTRVADAQVGPPRPSHWHTIAQRPILEHWATPSLELPTDVVRGLDDAQRATERDGFEHGGNIVRDKDRYATRAVGDATESSFDADEKDTGGKTYVGAYHTHPKDKDAGGYSGFSDADIANMTHEGRNVSLLRSGDTTRMLARTKEFEDQLAAAESPDELSGRMTEDYEAAYQAVLAKDPRNHYRAVESATQYTARKYHLLYYSGQGAKLNRVGAPRK